MNPDNGEVATAEHARDRFPRSMPPSRGARREQQRDPARPFDDDQGKRDGGTSLSLLPVSAAARRTVAEHPTAQNPPPGLQYNPYSDAEPGEVATVSADNQGPMPTATGKVDRGEGRRRS